MTPLILLVEDDPLVGRSLSQVLTQYRLDICPSLASSYAYLNRQRPDLIIVDRGLPDGDGLELAEYVAQLDQTAPFLILSAKASLADRLQGLRIGADEYLGKPFSTAELVLRLERLLSISKHPWRNRLRCGQLELLLDQGQVLIGSHILRLRRREFQVLTYLIRQQGHVVSRDQLINHIWPDGTIPSYATIDVYIRRLRMMLGPAGKVIRTVKGFGYSVGTELRSSRPKSAGKEPDLVGRSLPAGDLPVTAAPSGVS